MKDKKKSNKEKKPWEKIITKLQDPDTAKYSHTKLIVKSSLAWICMNYASGDPDELVKARLDQAIDNVEYCKRRLDKLQNKKKRSPEEEVELRELEAIASM